MFIREQVLDDLRREGAHLQVVHGTSDGPLSDLVTISVQDGDNGTTLCGVDVLYVSLGALISFPGRIRIGRKVERDDQTSTTSLVQGEAPRTHLCSGIHWCLTATTRPVLSSVHTHTQAIFVMSESD